MEGVLKDLQHGFRRMRRDPVATLVVLASLALGIGINASVFSLINLALLRPLPLDRPEQLVRIYTAKETGERFRAFSYPDYLDFREDGRVVSGLIAERFVPVSLSTEGRPELVWGELVSGNYFQVLGISPAVGRVLESEDDRHPGAHPVAVLGFKFWQRHFAGDPRIVGETVVLNGRDFTVVGVAPEGFAGTFVGGRADVWVPMMMQQTLMPVGNRLEQRGARWLTLTGRLKPGIRVEQARGVLSDVARRLAEEYPDSNEGVTINIVPFEEDTLPFQAKGVATKASGVLLGVTAAVLLIACANLASILLAQAATRQREIAMRQAVGASRGRLIRQFLTESVLLSLLAAAVALVLTTWANQLVSKIPLPDFLPIDLSASLDWRVVAFTLAVSLVVGIALGLTPALRATRFSLTAPLKGEGLDRAAHGMRLRNLLVVFQVTLSLVLLVCAGLFLKSLNKSLAVDPGFDAEKVAVAAVNPGLQGYEEGAARVLYRQVLERVRALPGVEAASLAEMIPLEAGGDQQMEVEIAGNEPTSVDYNVVSARYFQTMGIPLLRGRDFSDQEAQGEGSPVTSTAVINEVMARQYWPGADPLGQRFITAGGAAEVIGVVGNSKYGSLGESQKPYLYLSLAEQFEPAVAVHVRTSGDPGSVLGLVRREVQGLDENLPVYNAKTLEDQVRIALLPARLAASFMSTFGVLALILTALGTYGVMMYFVAQRRREIGIRMALGAGSADLLKRVLAQAMLLVAIGIAVGLVLAVAVARLLSASLYGVSSMDALIFAGAALLLLGVAASATYLPARQATQVDPAVVLSSQ